VYKCCWGLCWKVTKVLYWLNKPFLSNSNLSRYLLNDPRRLGTDSCLGCFHHEGVANVSDVSEVYPASIFRIEMSMVSQCSCTHRFWFNRSTGDEWGLVPIAEQQGQWRKKCYQNDHFMVTESPCPLPLLVRTWNQTPSSLPPKRSVKQKHIKTENIDSPIFHWYLSLRQKNMAMSPARPGNRNDCADEDQQQFTWPYKFTEHHNRNMTMDPSHGPIRKRIAVGEVHS
jgi:hypothetical protein